MIVFIVYVIDVFIMSVIVIFFCVYYKDVVGFFSVQGFVWIVFVIFICVVVYDGCDVCVVFVFLIV